MPILGMHSQLSFYFYSARIRVCLSNRGHFSTLVYQQVDIHMLSLQLMYFHLKRIFTFFYDNEQAAQYFLEILISNFRRTP